MTRQERRAARRLQEALHFSPCPSCRIDLVTGEGDRACHYYACPLEPDLLLVTCPTCNYNFASGEGRAECGDPPTCDYAVTEAPTHVAALAQWNALHTHASNAHGES